MTRKRGLSLVLALGLVHCAPSEPVDDARADAGHEHHATDGPEVYEARGTVLWFEPGRVYLNHEEMPGFMDAMAMGFDVEDDALLDGVSPGSSVEFRVVVESDTFYIDQIQLVE